MKFSYRKVSYKYILESDYTFELPETLWAQKQIGNEFVFVSRNMLVLRRGYAWDGCSGPTIDTETTMRAGLSHDTLYQLIREGLLPPSARVHIDRFFREILKEDQSLYLTEWAARGGQWRRRWLIAVSICRGFSLARRWVYFGAVRLFAGHAARRKTKE